MSDASRLHLYVRVVPKRIGVQVRTHAGDDARGPLLGVLQVRHDRAAALLDILAAGCAATGAPLTLDDRTAPPRSR